MTLEIILIGLAGILLALRQMNHSKRIEKIENRLAREELQRQIREQEVK